MNRRDRFVAELREEAKRRNLSFRWTTLPNREIDPKTARKIRKALGLD